MLKWFENWINKREKMRIAKGYDFAAGQLLKGIPPSELYKMVDCAKDFDDYGYFELGIEHAIEDWLLLKKTMNYTHK